MSFICIPMRMNLIKAPGERGSGPFSFERNGHLSSPSRSCLGSLFLHPWRNQGAELKPPDIWCPEEGTGAPDRDLRIFGTCTWTRGFEPPSPWTAHLRGRELALSSPQGQGHRMVRPPGVLQIRGKVSVRPPLERF